jgi:hypothetical protein
LHFHHVAAAVDADNTNILDGKISKVVEINAYDESGKQMCDGIRLLENYEQVSIVNRIGCPIVAQITHLFDPFRRFVCYAGFCRSRHPAGPISNSFSTVAIGYGEFYNNNSISHSIVTSSPDWILLAGKIKTIKATAISTDVLTKSVPNECARRFVALYVHSSSWPVFI